MALYSDRFVLNEKIALAWLPQRCAPSEAPFFHSSGIVGQPDRCTSASGPTTINMTSFTAGRPGSSEVPRNPLTRWDVSSIPANGIFLTKKLKNKNKMPNGWRTIKSLVHKIRLHGRRGKGTAGSFSREKSRHVPQKEGG